MNFLFRGFLSVKERLGKSLILLLVMTTISVFVLAGFSIESATETASVLARQKLGATVQLTQDMEKIKDKMRSESNGEKRLKFESTPIKIEDVEKVLTLDHISGYNLISTANAMANSFTAINSNDTTTEETNTNHMIKQPEGMNFGDLTIEGVSIMTEDNGDIVDGRAINDLDKDKNVAVVEETLASENDLKVGDKIKIASVEDSSEKELEIVGIYKTSDEISNNAFKNSMMNPYNKIYVPYTFANELKGTENKDTVEKAEFYIDDPINVDNFVEEGNKLDIDFETYKLDANNSAYDAMMGPIENVGSFAKTTVIIVSIAGAVILGLIIMLSIKERRNEIGILLSLGEKKSKIVAQFIAEILIILVLAIGSSSILGNQVSNVIGNQLVQKEIEVTNTKDSQDKFGMGRPGMSSNKAQNVETIDELDVNVTMDDFAKMSSVSVLIVLIGVLIPSLGIMRLQPKEILSKHD